MAIGALVLVCCIHLALYAQYRHGHIFTWRQLQEKNLVQYRPRRAAILCLNGTIWVNFYPSDSFYIELPKQDGPADKPWMKGQTGPEESLPIPQYKESADTLVITGGFDAPLHRPYSDPSYRNHLPQVNVYSPGFREIRLLNGQLVLGGSRSASGAPVIRLTAVNSTVWVADYDEPDPIPQRKEFFDSLDLHLSNTFLLLNRSASIRSAGIHLDGSSEINDRWSTIGQIGITGSDSSHIDLAGNNLKRATIDIH